MQNKGSKTFKQVLLIIFDGWGYSEEKKYNAIAQANPEYFNNLWSVYPHTLLKASGEAIGLPEGQIGTSEIAHSTIGAGKIIYTDIVRVNKMIQDNQVCDNQALETLFNHVKQNNSTLHFMGMVSPGGVHSHQEHLFALLRCAKEAGITKVIIHAFTDGRDVPPMSNDMYIKQLNDVIRKIGVGRIATVVGRYYAMDRDTNWERTQKAYDLLFEGTAEIHENTEDPAEVLKQIHAKGVEDQYIEPLVFLNADGKADVISQNDGVFFFNFRPDRARQISYKIAEVKNKMNLCFVTLSQYDKNLNCLVYLPKLSIETTLAGEISKAGLSQVHIAETEKFAHLTYYFDGERKENYPGEVYQLIPSKKVATFDLAPEMSAKEIADKAIENIQKGTSFIAINFANADMVGHVGKFEPTIEAIKVLDGQLKRVVEALLQNGGVAFITADHGNAELMWDEKNNQPHTAHTLNPVPAILTEEGVTLASNRSLEDVAPTILELFGLQKPQEMAGKSLIQ